MNFKFEPLRLFFHMLAIVKWPFYQCLLWVYDFEEITITLKIPRWGSQQDLPEQEILSLQTDFTPRK